MIFLSLFVLHFLHSEPSFSLSSTLEYVFVSFNFRCNKLFINFSCYSIFIKFSCQRFLLGKLIQHWQMYICFTLTYCTMCTSSESAAVKNRPYDLVYIILLISILTNNFLLNDPFGDFGDF